MSITTSRRKGAFAAAAVVLVGLSVLLAGPRPDAHPPRDTTASSTARVQPPRAPVVSGPSTVTTGRTETTQRRAAPPAPTAHAEREPRQAPSVALRDGRAATGVARAFLDGYLAFSYGHGKASAIRAAAAHLVRALDRAPPRVPAAVARARPRVTSLRALARASTREVIVVAAVNDGQRRYEVPITVRRAGDRWLVTEISG